MRKLRAFNNDDIPDDATLSSIKMKRMALAKQMIGKMGKSVNIETPFFIVWGCNTFIGNGVYMNREYVSRPRTGPLLINTQNLHL